MNSLGGPHNPDGLTDDQIGTKDGWRLLRENEVIQNGDEWWDGDFDNRFEPCHGNIGSLARTKNYTHRTKRPDPCSPSMMAKPALDPMDSKWHKFAPDDMPTGPFFASSTGQTCGPALYWDSAYAKSASTSYTHWMPAPPLPAPPQPETQRDMDEEAFRDTISCSDSKLTVWHAALAWERAEVAKMLPSHGEFTGGKSTAMIWQMLVDIRKRCQGGGR